MQENIIYEKDYLNSEKYIILDINNNVLNDYIIDNIYLDDGYLSNRGDSPKKYLYNDQENPLVISKERKNYLYINPEYFLNNKEKIENILCTYINNYKNESFKIGSLGLISDRIIDTICLNKNIKEVSLTKYSKEPYVLTKEDYIKFKKANIRVDTKFVCDKLKDNYDNIIMANSEKGLIGYYKYRDLISKDEIILKSNLNVEELNNLKYINSKLKVVIDHDDYEQLFLINNKLKELNKNNKVVLNVKDKVKFNNYIFDKDLDDENILIKVTDEDAISLKQYFKFEKMLYELIKGAKDLSPFERYIYAYNVTKQFKEYNENENNLNDSRRIYSMLVNEYMVCLGFSRMFGDLLDKLSIENTRYDVDVDDSYDNALKSQIDFYDTVSVRKNGHSRRYVHIVDPKYGIDGYYIADPTWDNSLEHDYYNHMVMTDEETTYLDRYNFTSSIDVFNVKNIEEYITKVKILMKKNTFDNFKSSLSFIISYIEKIDKDNFNNLREKYSYIDIMYFLWPNNLTDLIYDIGNIIINKVNKTVSGEVIFNAIENVYREGYKYSEEEIASKLLKTKEENFIRQGISFPARYRINEDGSREVIMNENNKFDFSLDSVKKI